MRLRVFFWSVWLLLSLAFSIRFIFADGEPCYDCQNCWQNIINCATNGDGNCSSNCVKFSPSDCSNFVSGVFVELETISNSVQYIEIYIHNYFSSLDNYVYPAITNVSDSVRFVMSALDNYSSSNSVALASSVSLLNYVRSRIISVSNSWSTVDGSNSGGLFVSNLLTSATRTIFFTQKVSSMASYVVPRLDSAISILSDLDDYSINEIVSARSDLEIALTFLDDLVYNIQQVSTNIDSASSLLRTIHNSSDNIARSVSSVNCEPCGRASNGSGGSGGIVDFTGVSAQLDEIKSLLQQVYDLIYYYYTDYNSARSYRPSGEPTYQAYASLGDNWFKRVEYLLYSSSSIASNNLEGTSDPDTIEGQTAFENETSDLEESVDGIVDSFDSSITEPWSKFSKSFKEFWDRLDAFKLPGQSSGSLGQLEWSHLEILKYEKDESSFSLTAESDLDNFPSVWYKFAVGFRILWFLLVLTLYTLFFVFMIKYSFKVAAFVTKLLNTSFGSG